MGKTPDLNHPEDTSPQGDTSPHLLKAAEMNAALRGLSRKVDSRKGASEPADRQCIKGHCPQACPGNGL